MFGLWGSDGAKSNSVRPSLTATDFRRRPLPSLERAFAARGSAFWAPGRQLIVAQPDVAKDILSNRHHLYQEHSDFFRTRRGRLPERSLQVTVGRAFRQHLTSHWTQRRSALHEALDALTQGASRWPDAGNRLIFRHVLQALVGLGDKDEEQLLDDIVERAVLAGALHRHSRWSRLRFRRRVARRLARAIRRRQRSNAPAVDMLGALAVAGIDTPVETLAEIVLSALFATAGSVGFTLGWCFYLLGLHGRHGEAAAAPGGVVREALRLWPIAWMLARRPATDHEVLGHPVTPDDQVVVCTYLLHRHPEFWHRPHAFLPQRWATGQPSSAYLPFGWGPHFCVAANWTYDCLEDVLRQVLAGFRPEVSCPVAQPHVGPALAPPEFTLTFSALS